jgi:hypothetical protein
MASPKDAADEPLLTVAPMGIYFAPLFWPSCGMPAPKTTSLGSERSSISIDWERLGSFAFRLVAGIGLVLFWLLLLSFCVNIIGFAIYFAWNLSFARMIGVVLTTPIVLVIWWLCFYMALDSLADMGIELKGAWSWLVIPVAPVLATLGFCFVNLSGFGQFLKKQHLAIVAFVFGISVLLVGLIVALI